MNAQSILPKGGTYGAGRIRRGGDEKAGLKINGSLRSQGADHNPRPGNLNRKYWEMREAKTSLLNSKGRAYQRTPNFQTPEMRRAAWQARGLWAWHNRCAKLTRKNLTTRGTVPKRRYFPAEDAATRAERLKVESRARMQRLRANRHANNLTSGGQKRRRKIFTKPSDLDKSWEATRATFAVPAVSFEDYEITTNRRGYK